MYIKLCLLSTCYLPHSSKYFTGIIVFNPYNPLGSILCFSHFTDEGVEDERSTERKEK